MKGIRRTNQTAPLKTRVKKLLQRYGLYEITATDLGDRAIELSGSDPSVDDRSLAVAAARTVPGVDRFVYRRDRA